MLIINIRSFRLNLVYSPSIYIPKLPVPVFPLVAPAPPDIAAFGISENIQSSRLYRLGEHYYNYSITRIK